MLNKKTITIGLACAVTISVLMAAGCDKNSGADKEKIFISGSFIQPWLAADWTLQNWKTELAYMKSVGMDQIIWQWTLDTFSKECHYPSRYDGYENVAANDQVALSLQAAKELQMSVWLGLNNSDQWWTMSGDDQWVEKEFDWSIKVADELWSRYGEKYGDTIAGFYLVMELDNCNFRGTEAMERMAKAYKKVCEFLHEKAGKKLLISPFFNENRVPPAMGPAEYAQFWADILKTAPIDIIAMQDGAGVGNCAVENTEKWIAELKKAAAKVRPQTEIWANVETFEPVDPNETLPVNFQPVSDMDRLQRQIMNQQDNAAKIICFSFCHYQSPQAGKEKEFEKYVELYERFAE